MARPVHFWRPKVYRGGTNLVTKNVPPGTIFARYNFCVTGPTGVYVNYDNNIVFTEKAVGEFMMFFRESFPQATVPIKMHILEDHAVPWAKSFHVGFGLLGEQGAESIHATFTQLSLSYTAITDKVQHLLYIVKEHLISISLLLSLLHKKE